LEKKKYCVLLWLLVWSRNKISKAWLEKFQIFEDVKSRNVKNQRWKSFFMYIRGIMHYECVFSKQMVKQTFYFKILERFQQHVYWEGPNLSMDKWILHCNNIPSLTVVTVKWFLVILTWFGETKDIVKLSHFESFEDIQSNVITAESIFGKLFPVMFQGMVKILKTVYI
jgi:hypothetical protein